MGRKCRGAGPGSGKHRDACERVDQPWSHRGGEFWIWNERSALMHRSHPTDPTRSKCAYVKDFSSKPHFTVVSPDDGNIDQTLCRACFGPPVDIAIPTWQLPESDASGADAGASQLGSSSSSSSSESGA